MSFKIKGTGYCLPKFILTNEKLTEMVDTNDEWITTRTGIKSRHIATDESCLDLAAAAAKMAIKNAGINPLDIDLIICSCVGSDYKTPSLACLVQKELEITNFCPSFDVNGACTGFIYALDIADSYFIAKKAKNILVIATEMMSKYVDWEDRATCVLFGDGAGACVLSEGDNLLAIKTMSKGDVNLLSIGDVNGTSPFNKKEEKNQYLNMIGSEVFKFAVISMCNDIKYVVEKSGLTLDDITKIIPHQANYRIIKAAQERLKVSADKVVSQIDSLGNTSSATIPIVLARMVERNELKKGDIIAMTAFGGGLTSGACVIRI